MPTRTFIDACVLMAKDLSPNNLYFLLYSVRPELVEGPPFMVRQAHHERLVCHGVIVIL